MRRHIMWRLIWVCAVSLCPIYGTLGLNGLNTSDGTRWHIFLWHSLYVKNTNKQKSRDYELIYLRLQIYCSTMIKICFSYATVWINMTFTRSHVLLSYRPLILGTIFEVNKELWVGGFGLNDPLRQYFSPYWAVSQWEEKRKDRREKKCPNNPHPHLLPAQ